MARTLVIDEDLDPRLAAHLNARGREAFNAGQVGTRGKVDQAVLRQLARLDYGWVLVTADDSMPLEHGKLIRDINATIATVDGAKKERSRVHGILTPDQFEFETVQRWAHKIADLAAGSVRRFSPTEHHEWTRRRR